jgi:N-acetylmuramoyl-L-alanine amidase
MKRIIVGVAALIAGLLFYCPESEAAGYTECGQYGRPGIMKYDDTEEQITEEIRLGEMELIAQLVQAEAGNQSLEGKRLVVDVILNRVADPRFPDTVEEVIFQPGQFSVVRNGAFEKAAWHMQETDFAAVAIEYEMHTNEEVLYFNNCSDVCGEGEPFKVGGHWFNA